MNAATLDRGMMKWAPYQSLVEQALFLAKMKREKQKVEKPLISREMAEEINEILVHYEGEEVKIRLWESGYLSELTTTIDRIDPVFKNLKADGRRIPFSSIVGLERV